MHSNQGCHLYWKRRKSRLGVSNSDYNGQFYRLSGSQSATFSEGLKKIFCDADILAWLWQGSTCDGVNVTSTRKMPSVRLKGLVVYHTLPATFSSKSSIFFYSVTCLECKEVTFFSKWAGLNSRLQFVKGINHTLFLIGKYVHDSFHSYQSIWIVLLLYLNRWLNPLKGLQCSLQVVF